MGRHIKPSIIFLLLLCIALACDENSSNNTTTRTIGFEGGTIKSSDGRLTLTIPAGALDEDTEISIRVLRGGNIPEEFSGLDFDRAYELSPDGLEFNTPVTASLLLDGPASNNNGLGADLEFLLTSSDGVIEILDNLEMDIDGDQDTVTISGEIGHFSTISKSQDSVTFSVENLPDGIIPPEIIFEPTAKVSSLDVTPEASYQDSSIAPVLPNFSSPINLPLVGEGELELLLSYTCKNGIGLFRSSVKVTSVFGQRPNPDNLFENIEVPIEPLIRLSKTITCIEGAPPPTTEPPPPPPQPTPTPSPPPAPTFEGTDIGGTWDLNCEVITEAFPLIVPNLGDPFNFQADIGVDPETLDTMINPQGGIFMLDGPLAPQPNGDFLFNGSGSGFLGDTNPNAANIQIEAENWIFSMDVPDSFSGNNQPGDVFVDDGLLRFNFPTLPLDSQSSLAECDGIRLGD